MSTVEDFENAPVGATATYALGSRAMKIDAVAPSWIAQNLVYLDDGEMADEGYVLDPSAPTTVREALDLAWELAHPVKEGQVIPKGTQYLEFHDSGPREYTALFDRKISPGSVPIRTLDPLPDPKPDWLDAPAVLAHTDNDDTRRVWTAHRDERWASTSHTYTRLWQNLRDVTPLYPKGQDK